MASSAFANAVTGPVQDLVMGLFGNYSQRKAEARQFEYNKRLATLQWDRSDQAAATNRQFQERMSSTAYQRAMDDMRAGGLNPILAYSQGGASSPSGSMPSYSSPGSVNTRGDAGIKAASASAAIRNMREQNANLQAQRDQIRAATDKTTAETRVIDQQGDRGEIFNLVFDFLRGLIGGDPDAAAGSAGSSARSWLGNIFGGNASSAAGFDAFMRRLRELQREQRERDQSRNAPPSNEQRRTS